VSQCSHREPKVPAVLIHHDQFPVRILFPLILFEIARPQETTGKELALFVRIELHQEGKVGELLDVIVEIFHLAIHMEFLENHMNARHQEGRIGPRSHRNPQVGELCHIRKIRSQIDDFSAVVLKFRSKVGVRSSGRWAGWIR